MYNYYKLVPYEISTILITIVFGYYYLSYLKFNRKKLFRLLDNFILLLFLSSLLKVIFWITRPYSIDFLSFPSNHTTVSFTLYYTEKKAKYLLFPVIVGFLRILEGYHTIIDIFGTILLFLVVSDIWDYIMERLSRYSLQFSLLFVSTHFLLTNDLTKAFLTILIPLGYFITEYIFYRNIESRYIDIIVAMGLALTYQIILGGVLASVAYISVLGTILIDNDGNVAVKSLERIVSTVITLSLLYINLLCIVCIIFAIFSLLLSCKLSKKFISTTSLVVLMILLFSFDLPEPDGINLLKLYL